MKSINPLIEIKAEGLGFPEGPVALIDGTILLCDLHKGLVNKIDKEGTITVFADLGGSPNGLALGPDDWLYVANNGGAMRWEYQDDLIISKGFDETGFDTRIERVHLVSGEIERILDHVEGYLLEAIDDLIFDPNGGFWFTDLGRDGKHSRSYGGIYWSSYDGTVSKQVAYPIVTGANGIALSPNGLTLYATEYGAGRIWAWTVDGPGSLKKEGNEAHGGRLIWQAPNAQLLDSMAIAASGNLIVATQPTGVFSIVSPSGQLINTIAMPEHSPTNLCFDQIDPTSVYATLSNTGVLAKIKWAEPGLLPYVPHNKTKK